MDPSFRDFLAREIESVREQGLFKEEWPILGEQGPEIRVEGRARAGAQLLRQQLPRPLRPPGAGRGRAPRARRVGLRHVLRALHLRHAGAAPRAREARSPPSSAWRTRSSTPPASTPTAASSSRCSGEDDAIITDQLNHASIIDGVRLCKAKRYVYEHADMADLEAKLKEAQALPLPADRHRRRLLHGRRRRAAAARSASWPSATARW